MDWANERYVRVYTRDTADDLVLSWQARGLWPLLVRKADRSGVIATNHGARGVAALVQWPPEIVEPALGELLVDGRIQECKEPQGYVIPNYIEAQEARSSDKLRARGSRERRRAESLRSSQRGGALQNRVTGRGAGKDAVGHIYVLHSPLRDLIKIGFTANAVADRVRQIETSSGESLSLLSFFTGTVGDEQELHKRFARQSVEGEWLSNTGAVSKWLKTLVLSNAESQPVTSGHTASHEVTPSRAVPSQTVLTVAPAPPTPVNGKAGIERFTQRYEQAYSAKPEWAQQAANYHRLAKEHGPQELVARIDRLFDGRGPDWIKPPYSPGTVVANWNHLVVDARAAQGKPKFAVIPTRKPEEDAS